MTGSRLTPEMIAAVQRTFSAREQSTVVAALEDVRGSTAADTERLRTAVLVLGTQPKPDRRRLQHFALAATKDFRDVLYWAEYDPGHINYQAAVKALGLPSQTV